MPFRFGADLASRVLPCEPAISFAFACRKWKIRHVIGEIDVLYVTRVQKERFEDAQQYEQLKNVYVVDAELMSKAKPDMILMHPLPRVYEIAMEVDEDPRAAYFRQMENGMYIRMALLAAVLGKA